MAITNRNRISLPLAVWLLHDDYDYRNEPNYISATSLLKSVKQIVLGKRVSRENNFDITELISSAFGKTIHSGIEKAWRDSGILGMKKLGYPDKVTENIVINPDEMELKLNPNAIPVWIEQRETRQLGDYLIGGKFDFVVDGRLFDFKSTSVYTYLMGNKDDEYSLQGSIYKWLNPDKITEDHIYINFIFTDWQRLQAETDPKYPKARVFEHPVALLSLHETEGWLRRKLSALSRAWNLPEAEIPPCNDKELWRSDPVYKYYSDPNKTDGRSSKNFTTLSDANIYLSNKGGKGVVKTFPGEVKACEYCPAYSICEQRKQYYAD